MTSTLLGFHPAHNCSKFLIETILAAIAQANVRAVVSAGWGSLDADILRDPKALGEAGSPDIFVLGNVPHDWLFKKVAAVCHHGGAGEFIAFSRK